LIFPKSEPDSYTLHLGSKEQNYTAEGSNCNKEEVPQIFLGLEQQRKVDILGELS